MTAISKEQIIAEISAHIEKESSGYSAWYCGITNDPNSRLFTEHNVPEKDAWWIHREAYSADDAREVEAYFVNQCGTDGGPGGGDYTSRHVYAYKKTASTNP
jgi:hypothetical protein